MARGPVASAPAGTHCPQVQDVVKCQMGMCRGDESEDSPDSCKNGQLQILVSEEAWAGHGWVLSVPPPAPYPKHLTFPSMRVRGQRRGLIQAQPLASGWNWASLSPQSVSPPVSWGWSRTCWALWTLLGREHLWVDPRAGVCLLSQP